MKKDYLTPDIQLMSLESGSILMSSSQEEKGATVNFENLTDGGDFIW